MHFVEMTGFVQGQRACSSAVLFGSCDALHHHRYNHPSRKIQRSRSVCRAALGDKISPLVSAGLGDVLFLGPRLAAGALLSGAEAIQRLPADVEKMNSILADDKMTLERKQEEILMEIEDRVAGLLEKGLDVENGVIDTISGAIPEELRNSIPEPVKELLLTKRTVPSQDAAQTGTAGMGATNKPLATWTISSIDTDDDSLVYGSPLQGSAGANGSNGMENDVDEMEQVVSPAAMAKSQAAAELIEIQTAVYGLKECIDMLKKNDDPSKVNMLKFNIREASQNVSQRLEQGAAVTGPGAGAEVSSAVNEARALLVEVGSIL